MTSLPAVTGRHLVLLSLRPCLSVCLSICLSVSGVWVILNTGAKWRVIQLSDDSRMLKTHLFE